MSHINIRETKRKPLPGKEKGGHRFVAIVSFHVSHEAMLKASTGKETVFFDRENLWDVSFGCVDCEMPWSEDIKRYCHAPAYKG